MLVGVDKALDLYCGVESVCDSSVVHFAWKLYEGDGTVINWCFVDVLVFFGNEYYLRDLEGFGEVT